jgi:hypothetical protein
MVDNSNWDEGEVNRKRRDLLKSAGVAPFGLWGVQDSINRGRVVKTGSKVNFIELNHLIEEDSIEGAKSHRDKFVTYSVNESDNEFIYNRVMSDSTLRKIIENDIACLLDGKYFFSKPSEEVNIPAIKTRVFAFRKGYRFHTGVDLITAQEYTRPQATLRFDSEGKVEFSSRGETITIPPGETKRTSSKEKERDVASGQGPTTMTLSHYWVVANSGRLSIKKADN